MNQVENLYQILGVAADASAEDIKKAYRDKCFILHPDRMTGLPESTKRKAQEELIKVNKAFAVLKDPGKRREYDAWLIKKTPKPEVYTSRPQDIQSKKTQSQKQSGSVIRNHVKPNRRRKNIVVDTKWLATIVLSTFFGFLALDRFFLRQYKFALWKLVTLGGAGLWWLADLVYFGVKSDDFKSVLENSSQNKNYSKIIAVSATSWFIIVCLAIFLLFIPKLNVQPSISIESNSSIIGTTFTGQGSGFTHSDWVVIQINASNSSPESELPIITKSYRSDPDGTIGFIFIYESELPPGKYSCKATDKNTGLATTEDFEILPARFRNK